MDKGSTFKELSKEHFYYYKNGPHFKILYILQKEFTLDLLHNKPAAIYKPQKRKNYLTSPVSLFNHVQ